MGIVQPNEPDSQRLELESRQIGSLRVGRVKIEFDGKLDAQRKCELNSTKRGRGLAPEMPPSKTFTITDIKTIQTTCLT